MATRTSHANRHRAIGSFLPFLALVTPLPLPQPWSGAHRCILGHFCANGTIPQTHLDLVDRHAGSVSETAAVGETSPTLGEAFPALEEAFPALEEAAPAAVESTT